MNHPLRRATPVPHPAWTEARDAILARAATPGTILLVGPPGTGKTVLLRDLAAHWRTQGRPVETVGQGDLPVQLAAGTTTLVDETLRMAPLSLARLLAQREFVVVLADTDRLADSPAGADIVRLRPLTDSEMRQFAADWRAAAGQPGPALPPDALARLVAHANGTVRLAAQLLGGAAAVVASTGDAILTGTDIDHAAAMRQNWQLPPDPVPAASSAQAVPRLRRVAAGTALAAAVALFWAVRPAEPPQAARPSASLPPLRLADLTTPVLLAEPAPRIAFTPIPSAAMAVPPRTFPVPAPELAMHPLPTPAARVDVALVPAPNAALLNELPVAVAEAAPPRRLAAAAAPLARPTAGRLARRAGGPGMVLVAQRGDTLESLYAELYRDRAAPPYTDVMAVNPRPLQPGAIVLFPDPPGGWSPVQR